METVNKLDWLCSCLIHYLFVFLSEAELEAFAEVRRDFLLLNLERSLQITCRDFEKTLSQLEAQDLVSLLTLFEEEIAQINTLQDTPHSNALGRFLLDMVTLQGRVKQYHQRLTHLYNRVLKQDPNFHSITGYERLIFLNKRLSRMADLLFKSLLEGR